VAQNWVFTKGLDNVNAGNISIGVNTFKVALLTALPAGGVQDTANVWTDVSGSEVASGGGYTTGGQTIALSHSVYTTGGVHRSTVNGPSNTTWTSATFAAACAVVYRSDGAANYVLALVDFGGTKTSSGGSFVITWDATNGVYYLTNTPV
jgi:hypothetical protein